MQNARALRDAPIVFVAVILIAAFASYWLSGVRYEGVLDQKNGTIEALKTQLSGLQDQVKTLQQQLEHRGQQQAPSVPVRDPDGIYQFGVQVGSVQGPQVDESHGTISFGAIVGAVKLNTDRDFEYRDLVLRINGFATETRAGMAGQAVGRALSQVTCEIVGRVH
jgi:hypothetical protein